LVKASVSVFQAFDVSLVLPFEIQYVKYDHYTHSKFAHQTSLLLMEWALIKWSKCLALDLF